MERRGFVTSGRVPGVAGLTGGGATRSPLLCRRLGGARGRTPAERIPVA